jgi:hypothetical protein
VLDTDGPCPLEDIADTKHYAELKTDQMGIPLTQVGPISSMPGWWQKSIRGM